MKRGFVLRRIAAQEFDDSIAFYESEREGLGQEFRAIIEQQFQRIADNPERFPQSARRSPSGRWFSAGFLLWFIF